MLTEQVSIIEDIGGGETRTVSKTIPSTEFVVKIDNTLYRPAITTEVEIENDGETTTTRDQCGHVERSRTGDDGWRIRAQGIVTGNTSRDNNLDLQLLRDEVASASDLKVRTDMIAGFFEVSNTVITQSSDLVSINTNDTDGTEKAFEFQIQIGEDSSE